MQSADTVQPNIQKKQMSSSLTKLMKMLKARTKRVSKKRVKKRAKI